jgi:hypothetical protein
MEELKNDTPIFAKKPEQKFKKPKRKHYQSELKPDVAKYLHKKLAEKLNVRRIKVPWEKMTANDIMNWPENVEFRNVNRMSAADASRLQELAKNDLLDFSPEFLSRLKVTRRGDDELKSEMTKHLSKKLAQRLNVQSIKQLPWNKMTADNIINWPQEVEFKRFDKMNMEKLKKIHELVEEDKLDFSHQLISRLKIKSKGFNEILSDIRKYFGDKLAKKLNVDSIRVPWSQMKATDIINWPENVEFKPVKRMSMQELKLIDKLAKKDQLDFSSEFLSKVLVCNT